MRRKPPISLCYNAINDELTKKVHIMAASHQDQKEADRENAKKVIYHYLMEFNKKYPGFAKGFYNSDEFTFTLPEILVARNDEFFGQLKQAGLALSKVSLRHLEREKPTYKVYYLQITDADALSKFITDHQAIAQTTVKGLITFEEQPSLFRSPDHKMQAAQAQQEQMEGQEHIEQLEKLISAAYGRDVTLIPSDLKIALEKNDKNVSFVTAEYSLDSKTIPELRRKRQAQEGQEGGNKYALDGIASVGEASKQGHSKKKIIITDWKKLLLSLQRMLAEKELSKGTIYENDANRSKAEQAIQHFQIIKGVVQPGIVSARYVERGSS